MMAGGLVVEPLDVAVEIRAVGHIRGVAAALIAADHADDRPVWETGSKRVTHGLPLVPTE